MADTKYFVVEARLPIQIGEDISPEEAARKAARRIEREYGVDVSNWYLRVFEYGGDPEQVGPIREWFSNPAGSKFRDKDANIELHQVMADEGKTPND